MLKAKVAGALNRYGFAIDLGVVASAYYGCVKHCIVQSMSRLRIPDDRSSFSSFLFCLE